MLFRSGWQRLGPFGGNVKEVVYAPSNPNIIYAMLDNMTVPLYKSVDNGKTWQILSLPFAFYKPTAIAVSPVDPDIVLFSDGASVLRSTDGGQTWTQKGKTALTTIKFSTASPNKVYGTGDGKLLHRSIDSGLTWEVISENYILKIALDPFNECRILASGVRRNNLYSARGLYESIDDGATWSFWG